MLGDLLIRVWVHMPPKEVAIYCGNIGSKWLGATIRNRTRVQIQCPHIIDGLPANPTTEYEKLGTDHASGMIVTTARSRPLTTRVHSRDPGAQSYGQLVTDLTLKNPAC